MVGMTMATETITTMGTAVAVTMGTGTCVTLAEISVTVRVVPARFLTVNVCDSLVLSGKSPAFSTSMTA